MIKLARLLIITTTVSLLLTACGPIGSSDTAKTVVITPAIKGNSANLNVGDTLELQIPTIPTAGFEWQVQDLDTAVLKQAGDAVYTASTSPNAAGGIVTIKFNAVGTGSTTVHLLYMNSSTAGAPSLSSNSLAVTVEVK